MENLARYIIRASFSQERMQYLADEGTVIYSAKDGKIGGLRRPRVARRPCARIVPNRVSRWFGTMGGTATLAGGRAEKAPKITPSEHHANQIGPPRMPEKLGTADSENL